MKNKLEMIFAVATLALVSLAAQTALAQDGTIAPGEKFRPDSVLGGDCRMSKLVTFHSVK